MSSSRVAVTLCRFTSHLVFSFRNASLMARGSTMMGPQQLVSQVRVPSSQMQMQQGQQQPGQPPGQAGAVPPGLGRVLSVPSAFSPSNAAGGPGSPALGGMMGPATPSMASRAARRTSGRPGQFQFNVRGGVPSTPLAGGSPGGAARKYQAFTPPPPEPASPASPPAAAALPPQASVGAGAAAAPSPASQPQPQPQSLQRHRSQHDVESSPL